MDKLIEELRAQRDQIQKHLDWIDRKLAEADVDKTPQENSAHKAPPIPEPKKAPASDISTYASPSPELNEGPDPEKFATAPVQGDVNKAKVGCLILFILGTALFLFLLFVLPGLLY